jgi:hypothetical protein
MWTYEGLVQGVSDEGVSGDMVSGFEVVMQV